MTRILIDTMPMIQDSKGVWHWIGTWQKPPAIRWSSRWPDFIHFPWAARFLSARSHNRKRTRKLNQEPINMVQGTDGIWRNTTGPRCRRKRTASKPAPRSKPWRTPDLYSYPYRHPSFRCVTAIRF